jgi:hypothetical protein
MPFSEPFEVYFNPAEFGVTALLRGSTPVNGIFDAAYLEPLGNSVEGVAPVFSCAFPGAVQGDSLTISGSAYVIRGVEPDGTGLFLWRLERQ